MLQLRVNGNPVDWFEARTPKKRPKYLPLVVLPYRFTPPPTKPVGNRHMRRATARLTRDQ